MGQPVIQLSSLGGLGLIIEYASGVLYTNQAGGHACCQPTAEGVLVPLGEECNIEKKLVEFFARAGRLQPSHADALDIILHTQEEPFVVTPTFFLEVDRARLDDSMEAWLYVTILSCPDEHMIAYVGGDHEGRYSDVVTLSGRAWNPADQPELGRHGMLCPFSGFGRRRPAVLTWQNSD